MEWHVELRLDVGVALEAERRLRGLEKVLLVLACMDAVAADAAYIRFAVTGALEVGMLALVASQAPGIHFLRRGLGRIEDLGGITAAVGVGLAGAVAVLASDAVLAVRQCKLAVRVGDETLSHFLMAGCAGLGSNKIRRLRVLDLRTGCFSAGRRSRQRVGAKEYSA